MKAEHLLRLEMSTHMDSSPEMNLSELMRKRSALWQNARKLDSASGFKGTKDSWLEDRQATVRRYIGASRFQRTRRKLGGVMPIMLVGEPGSGKTTLGKQTLYRTLYPDTMEDASAPLACYEGDGDAEIPIHQWTFEWGDACSLIENALPDGVDYLNNEALRRQKILELLYASELFGVGLEMMCEESSERALDIILIDSPGGTGIDRATNQLRNFINKQGPFEHLSYFFPQIIGLVASPAVLEHGRALRGGMYSFSTPQEMVTYLVAKGVDIDLESPDAINIIHRYAKGSATPQQIEMIMREIEEYQQQRLRALKPKAHASDIQDLITLYRSNQTARQHDLGHLFLPDYLQNVLQIQHPNNYLTLMNEDVLSEVAFPAEVGSNHPFEIPGFVEEMKKRTRDRLHFTL